MDQFNDQFAEAVTILQQARTVVALTGAGVSTPSGIPDFRGAAHGLWEETDPLAVASSLTFRYEPERFFAWVRPLARLMQAAEPNDAHRALAALEAQGTLHTVITQNIDELHRRAGSQRLLELHGSLSTATCLRCYANCLAAEPMLLFIETGALPRCVACGGLLKPNVTLMGEELPAKVLRAAKQAVRECDALLVAGTSLEVMPAASLPVEALNAGAKVIMVNREQTILDERAAVVLRGDVAELLPRLAAAVGGFQHDRA